MEVLIPPPPTVEAAIDDLISRFLNLPPGEECTVERVFFQIQQAHWFYVDEWADPEGWDDETNSNTEREDSGGGGGGGDGGGGGGSKNNKLRIKNARAVLPYLRFDAFSRRTFAASPMLREYCGQHVEFKASFKAYMNTIPRYGCILINSAMDHVLLVQGYGSKTYGWPRGKVNQGELGIDCAGREAYEETGYNPRALLRESDFLEVQDADGAANRLYIGVGVPDDGSVNFAPLLAKEVGDIAWVEMASIDSRERRGVALAPGGGFKTVKLWGIGGFINRLRAWIFERKTGGYGGKPGGTLSGKALKRAAREAREARESAAIAASLAADSQAKNARIQVPPPLRPPPPSSARAARIAALSGGGGGGGVVTASSGGGENSATSAPATPLAVPITAAAAAAVAAPLGKAGGWSVQDMFAANSQLLGRDFTYNGNSHDFGVYEDDGGDAIARSGVKPVRVVPRVAALLAEGTLIEGGLGGATLEQKQQRVPKSDEHTTITTTTTTTTRVNNNNNNSVKPVKSTHHHVTAASAAVFSFDTSAIMAAFG